MASFIVCITGSALLLAFSMTACSDPGIVYRPAERRIPPPPAAAAAVGGESGGGGGEAAVVDATLPPMAMEEGGVLCGEACFTAVCRQHRSDYPLPPHDGKCITHEALCAARLFCTSAQISPLLLP